MKAFLWRLLYAAICAFMFLWVFPLFLGVIGFPMSGNLMELIRVCVACLALLYVMFGPAPPAPW